MFDSKRLECTLRHLSALTQLLLLSLVLGFGHVVDEDLKAGSKALRTRVR